MNYRTVDDWLGRQSVTVRTALIRLKWSIVYLSDAYIDLFNNVQDAVFGRHNKYISRAVGSFLALIAWLGPGYWLG